MNDNRRTDARVKRDEEAGAVLVVVMLVMLGLLGLGVTALWLTSGNMQISSNMNQRTQALYVAEAGIERARDILNGPVPPDVTALLTGASPGYDNVPTAVDPTTGAPNGVGAIMVDPGAASAPLRVVSYPPASFQRGGGTAAAPSATVMGTYTVWIRNDTAECRQNNFTTDSNNAVTVRSQGVGPDGRTTVVLEVTLGQSPAGAAGGATPTSGAPVLCNSGKNSCDDNNSTVNGVVVN